MLSTYSAKPTWHTTEKPFEAGDASVRRHPERSWVRQDVSPSHLTVTLDGPVRQGCVAGVVRCARYARLWSGIECSHRFWWRR